mgnify:CR=1 FL=1
MGEHARHQMRARGGSWHQWRSEGPAGPATAGGPAGLKGPARGPPGRSSRRNPLARGPNKLFAGGPENCRYATDITPHLKSLHWLKITQRIQYKIISLTYKSLQFKQPSSILDLLKIQPTHSTRSSAVVTLQRPSNPSRLKITDRSFYHQAPALWNSLPQHLRALSSTSSTQTNYSLLSLFSSQFHKQLKTYLFLQSYPP